MTYSKQKKKAVKTKYLDMLKTIPQNHINNNLQIYSNFNFKKS